MPFCKCPKCKAVFTLQVADEKAWRAEKWPTYASSEVVPETCPRCAEKALDRMKEAGSGPLPSLG
jgi:hypothetical protein